MEELSEAENKCMLRIHGKPLIQYSLDNASAIADVSDIVVVVGYQAESIINTFGTAYTGKRIAYVIQKEQKGLVHAMECSRSYIGGDDFFLFLADEVIIGGRHKEMLDLFYRDGLFCVCGVYPQEDLEMIRRTYSLISGLDQRIFRLIEKPRKPFSPLMGTGNILFKAAIFDYIGLTPINPHRGEKELPDLIQCAIDDGEVVKYVSVCSRYINVNSLEEWKVLESEHWEVNDENSSFATSRSPAKG